jgi:WD40 repeat protein
MPRPGGRSNPPLGLVRIAAAIVFLFFAPAAAAEPFSLAAIAFHPKSNTLVLARGHNGELRLVDFAEPGKPAARAFGAKIGAAIFLNDGRRIVTGGADGTVRIWSPEATEAGAPILGSGEAITSIAVSASDRFLATVDRNLTLRIWQAEGPGFRQRLQIPLQPKSNPSEGSDVAFVPDESAVAAISLFGNVFMRTIDGRPVAVPRARGDYESCCGVRIGFSGDGRFLIARRGYQPGYDAFVWTLRGGRVEGGRKFEEAVEVRDFAVLQGAAELVILDALGLRRVEAGGMRGAMLVPGEAAAQIRGIAVSADEARLATIEPDDTIVYRAGDGAPLGRISLR